MKKLEIPANHPRPAFFRPDWESLNGLWHFAFDNLDRGIGEHWEAKELSGSILVPFCYQALRSGINDQSYHPVVWYQRTFTPEEGWRKKRVLLHLEGVDQRHDLWINGYHVGGHSGGNARSTFDISAWLQAGENTICLRCSDTWDWSKPQGKQAPIERIDRCWYTQTTGIWKSAWLEIVPDVYVVSARITPDIDRQEIALELELNRLEAGLSLRVDVAYHDTPVVSMEITPQKKRFSVPLAIASPDYVDELHYWTPEQPELFDLYLTTKAPSGSCDFVQTYFGMRKIEARNGAVYLNNRPYFLRMILDQGYWRESLMTPPSDNSLREDVLLTKSFGFNGARKHQKIEDERYYYWADQLGLLVWAEMPSAYEFCPSEVTTVLSEWADIVKQLYNYPSIMAWVPFNESWGIRNVLTDPMQQHLAEAAYHLTKALDRTRLVSTNDGWEQVHSDLCCIHDYYGSADAFRQKYRDMEQLLQTDAQGRKLYAEGHSYAGQPIILSEYGGIACGQAQDGAWGYNEGVDGAESLLNKLADITQPVLENPRMAGYCYTQLTDVMQEINGLADADHHPKAEIAAIRAIFGENRSVK